MFNRSLLQLLDYKPWRYTVQPTYDANGNQLTAGTKQTLNGVFILCAPELVQMMKDGLDQASQDEIDSYLFQVTVDQAGMWHVPVWAGSDNATYIRVPAAVWNDPTTDPPAKVKRYFKALWQEITS